MAGESLVRSRIYRGDSWVESFVFLDATQAPIDLSQSSARIHVRDQTGQLVLAATTNNGRLTVAPQQQGRLDLRVEYSATPPAGVYRWDLEVTHEDGIRRTYVSGVLEVLEDVTHD